MLCASPDYIASAGAPATPDALAGQACIVNSTISPTNQWQFIVDGKRRSVGVRARIRVNCARPVRTLVLAGYGIGLCLLPTVRKGIAAGRLVRLLEAYEVWPTSGDLVENRPARSRWHSDYACAFARCCS